MICPYCEETISTNAIDKHDGCCPHCGTFLDHTEVDEDEELALHEDDAEDYEEKFGHPTRSYEMRDEFDDYLEEEERLEEEARERKRREHFTSDM